MSTTPFTGTLESRVGSRPGMDIVPDPIIPVPEPTVFDPARFFHPMHVCLMHSKGRLPIVISMATYSYTYSNACPLIKREWHAAGLDPVPPNGPLVLTNRLGIVINSKNFWRFHRTKDTCIAWHGDASIAHLVELAVTKRATLSAHFHHLAVTTTAAYFATRDAAAGDAPPNPYCDSSPWIQRWGALYEREAQGSLGRAWGLQDPKSYLRALVKGDGEERFSEDDEVAIEMYVDMEGAGRIRRDEEYRAIMQSIWDGQASVKEVGEAYDGDDDDDFYGDDDIKVEDA